MLGCHAQTPFFKLIVFFMLLFLAILPTCVFAVFYDYTIVTYTSLLFSLKSYMQRRYGQDMSTILKSLAERKSRTGSENFRQLKNSELFERLCFHLLLCDQCQFVHFKMGVRAWACRALVWYEDMLWYINVQHRQSCELYCVPLTRHILCDSEVSAWSEYPIEKLVNF